MLRIRDVYPGPGFFPFRIPNPMTPDPNFLHPASVQKKLLSILTQKTVSKLSEIWSGCSSRIRNTIIFNRTQWHTVPYCKYETPEWHRFERQPHLWNWAMPPTYRSSYLDKVVRKHTDLAPEAASPPSSLQPLHICDHVTHPATQQLLSKIR